MSEIPSVNRFETNLMKEKIDWSLTAIYQWSLAWEPVIQDVKWQLYTEQEIDQLLHQA